MLYSIYKLRSILVENKLYIEYKEANGNLFNRAIGEETSDFLKQSNKEYIIYPLTILK